MIPVMDVGKKIGEFSCSAQEATAHGWHRCTVKQLKFYPSDAHAGGWVDVLHDGWHICDCGYEWPRC